MKVKVKVWIEDDNKNLIFGSGKNEILNYIQDTGSISKAAKITKMNYKKAWSHIQILENYVEDKLVITQKGRGENSGSKLTQKAKEIIKLYETLDNDVKEYTKKRFEELFLEDEKELIKPKEKDDL